VSSHAVPVDPRGIARRIAVPRVGASALATVGFAALLAAAGLVGQGGLQLGPLTTVEIPYPCSNAEYEAAMGAAMESARQAGIEAVAFGDLFLEDVRRYREDRLRGSGITPLFPIWGTPTDVLARDMVAAGLRARLTCVDPRKLPAAFAGRDFDAVMLDDLARLHPEIDPCGERGEFHSFAYDGPMFARSVPIRAGDVVERDGFVFADLTLGQSG